MANIFQKRRQMIDEASGYADPKKKKAQPKTKPKPRKLPPLGKKYDPADYPR